MRKSLIILTLTTIGLISCGQSGESTSEKGAINLKIVDSIKNAQKPLIPHPDTYIDTEYKYTDSTGKAVIIQNSFPKGGPYELKGIKFGHAIFWTRVINETASPFELTINFPADSFAIFPSPDSYLKLFLPPDIMTLEKESLYGYGITGLKSFLETDYNKPTILKRTINPKEECLFYIAMFSYQAGGFVRAGLVLKEQGLFYRASILPHLDSALIPCGQIVFKK